MTDLHKSSGETAPDRHVLDLEAADIMRALGWTTEEVSRMAEADSQFSRLATAMAASAEPAPEPEAEL